MIVPIALVAPMYFILKDKSDVTKKAAVLALSVLNMLQHLLKPYIYPQYFGEGFGARSTAYNMCALLILISPIVWLIGSELWKNFLFYIGSIAGLSSILVTYWLAEPVEEQIRFVICHALLFATSFLPLLLGIFRVNYRKFWKLPFLFYACLMVLIINNTITFTMGIAGDTGSLTLFEFLYRENPCLAMHPPSDYPFVLSLVKIFTPDVFLGAKGGVETPILWMAIPLFLLITVVGFILGAVLDFERFSSDAKKLLHKLFG